MATKPPTSNHILVIYEPAIWVAHFWNPPHLLAVQQVTSTGGIRAPVPWALTCVQPAICCSLARIIAVKSIWNTGKSRLYMCIYVYVYIYIYVYIFWSMFVYSGQIIAIYEPELRPLLFGPKKSRPFRENSPEKSKWFRREVATWGRCNLPRDDLVGGWATPLKNMSSSIGMMRFPILMGT